MNDSAAMPAMIQAWRCVGCGRIEAPQPCIGVCQDRKVMVVDIHEHERVLRETAQLHHRIDALRMLLARFTRAQPRGEGWADAWEQLQAQARKALDADARMEGAASPATFDD